MLEKNENIHLPYMLLSIKEAETYVGATHPNPAVGACLVKDGRILAIAAHQKAGSAHAEKLVIETALQKHGRDEVSKSTLYVTLEPCNHFGKTPPCTRAILEAGIRKVVFGSADPNPAVSGGGAEKLRSAGLEVVAGIAKTLCEELIAPFKKWSTQHLPWVVHKLAYRETLNGLTMLPDNGRTTFTSEKSLELAHHERRKSEAILTGIGTVVADNPLFTVRKVEDHPQKKRIIAVLTIKGRSLPPAWKKRQEELGFEVLCFGDIHTALKTLAAKNVLRVLVEAGPNLSQFIEKENLWDERIIFIHRGENDQVFREFNH